MTQHKHLHHLSESALSHVRIHIYHMLLLVINMTQHKHVHHLSERARAVT